MPRLVNVREYRWVRPEDVLPEPVDLIETREKAIQNSRDRYALFRRAMQYSDEELESAVKPDSGNDLCWLYYTSLQEAREWLRYQIDTFGPTDERTVLVLRLVT